MMNTQMTKRILIADDEPLYLRTTGQLLRKAGYECDCVADADAALEKLRSEQFDLDSVRPEHAGQPEARIASARTYSMAAYSTDCDYRRAIVAHCDRKRSAGHRGLSAQASQVRRPAGQRASRACTVDHKPF